MIDIRYIVGLRLEDSTKILVCIYNNHFADSIRESSKWQEKLNSFLMINGFLIHYNNKYQVFIDKKENSINILVKVIPAKEINAINF